MVSADVGHGQFVQLDVAKDKLTQTGIPERLLNTLGLYTGLTPDEIGKDLQEKARMLKWLVSQNISDVHQIGLIISKYYSGRFKV